MDPLGGGQGFLLPARYSFPRLRFQSWRRLLQVRTAEGVLHRKESVLGARGEQVPAIPGAKALNRRPSGLFAPSRKAFHQGATCPRAAEYRSPETASPRPPEGRARPLLLLLLPLAAAGGDWRSPG